MRTAMIFMTVLAMSGAANAQQTDRFILERDGDRFVRLDTTNGEVSTCRDESGRLVCRMVADERMALEDELERVRARLDTVEKRVAALEGNKSGANLPSEQEIDQTVSYMQRFFRAFLDIVKEFDRDLRSEPPNGENAPNKT